MTMQKFNMQILQSHIGVIETNTTSRDYLMFDYIQSRP